MYFLGVLAPKTVENTCKTTFFGHHWALYCISGEKWSEKCVKKKTKLKLKDFDYMGTLMSKLAPSMG